MKTFFKQTALVAFALTLVISLGSCEATRNANNKQKGAVIGATGGAILGAIIGNNVGKGGNGELGAVIGGVVGGGAGVLIGNKMDKQAQKIEQEIPGAQVERVDDGIVVTFDENSGVYFDTAKYNVNAASQSILDKLSNVLVEYPDTDVLVVGHTDSVGADDMNMRLSKNRAQSVTNYFVQTKGLGAGRFTTNWYGETAPVADNTTAEGRAKNRRVNLAIVPNEKMKTEAKQQAGE
ncbi:outer membrane protein/peptidoglycan-associated (lipo)protein [Aequorivita sublithincola DSM 14238]|uniref:Outer membrane protein/peptidoglycan-associated (Lipo)protein n=1 Tax=Aequorivita sublithincola (strain DSM 14238 / LMG 21431 / ACAM 643 / 9-3) TaxID=746697 RepID=I3YYU8_AEQSU|nr:OmpA family protein [Aequorivita sublithincola]AFL82166.1 outer membrane protein/peptidoglycan-associated (lipo)protein [Aequorivita sublithincola DSM 14238]